MRRAASLFSSKALTQLEAGATGFVESMKPALGENVALGAGEVAPMGARFGAGNNQLIKGRMKTVRNIKKITSAMKLVAASKLRLAQASVEKSRGIIDPLCRVMGDLPSTSAQKTVIVPITSDRGLCGGINTTVSKYARLVSKVAESNGAENSLIVVGEKGKAQLSRDQADKITMTVADVAKARITFAAASLIAEEVLKQDVGAARILFNRFNSAISFKPTIATVLSTETLEADAELGKAMQKFQVKGANIREEAMENLAEFHMASVLYNGLLENNCSENASRMQAMENSTKNASEMLDRLTLQYNRARQAGITTELIEIISGASALEG